MSRVGAFNELAGVLFASGHRLKDSRLLANWLRISPAGRDALVLGVAVACAALTGCDNTGGGGANTPLTRGEIVEHDVACRSTDILGEVSTADAVSYVCDIFNSIPGASCSVELDDCNTWERQLYVGTNLFLPPGTSESWNGMGGRGQLLGEGALCALRELSSALGGPLVSERSYSIGLGEVSVRQQIGFTSFQPINPVFRGYRTVSFCAPIIGCFDSISQPFSVRLSKFGFVGAGKPKSGNFEVYDMFGLDFRVEESNTQIHIEPPSFPVATPIGVFDVQPEFDYRAVGNVTWMGFIRGLNTAQTQRTLWFQPTNPTDYVLLEDLYGVLEGLDVSTRARVGSANRGWDSQIALGNRDPGEEAALWQPDPNATVNPRPDWMLPNPAQADADIQIPRVANERVPSIETTARARVTYPEPGAALDLLPDWVKDLPYSPDVDFGIWIEPVFRAAFSGQFNVYAAEATRYTGENFGGGAWSKTDLLMQTGLGASLSFVVNAGMDLTITISPPIVGETTLVNVHPKFKVPIGGTETRNVGEFAYFNTEVAPLANTLPEFASGEVRLFSGEIPADPSAWIDACLDPDDPLPVETPPEPTGEPGDPTLLYDPETVLWPCNICLGVAEPATFNDPDTGQPVTIQGQFSLLFESTSVPGDHWQCDLPSKIGCMDLCKMTLVPGAGGEVTPVFEYAKGPNDFEPQEGSPTAFQCYFEPPK